MGSGNTKIKDNYKLRLIDDFEHKSNTSTPTLTNRKKSTSSVTPVDDSPVSLSDSPKPSR